MAFKLFDYQSSGSGVSKIAPQKKPFFRYWEIFGRKFWKIIELNLLYILFCIPVVTFGPATAALTHVMRKFILERGRALYLTNFLPHSKRISNSPLLIGIIDVVGVAALVVALFEFMATDKLPEGMIIYICVFICLATLLYIMHFYIYLEIVALKLSLKSYAEKRIASCFSRRQA